MSASNTQADLHPRIDRAMRGSGTKAPDKQMALGKLSAGDRIHALLDAKPFHEYEVFVEHRYRDVDMDKSMDHAIKLGMPIIRINGSGSARIQEGGDSLVPGGRATHLAR